MSLILALVLLSQAPEEGRAPDADAAPTAVDVARIDLGFTRAVEESIAREPGTKVPAAYRGLIALLGCDSYRGRVDATTRLESAVRRDPASIRWVFWGRCHRDNEIRHRSNAIIRRLNPCPTCKGRRVSPAMGADYPCGDCQVWDAGIQDYISTTPWPYGPWD